LHIAETVRGVTPAAVAAIHDRQCGRARLDHAWQRFKGAAVSSFAFVETVGLACLGRLVSDGFGLGRHWPSSPEAGLPAAASGRLGPSLDGDALLPGAGIPPAERAGLAAAILAGMSLERDFARLVMLTGHQSSTVNNPQARGLDCGACGGQSGAANARLAAALLNDLATREGLEGLGIRVPPTTLFVAALHDTATDEVRILDRALVPASHAADVTALERRLAAASASARAERAGPLKLDPKQPLDRQLQRRVADWAETRPEWGLAGCAAFIAAPRHRTAGRDLGGAVFLHSYDWQDDPAFGTLELIMTAPMVVAAWINLQYYASTVDNRVFGSGNKVLHNVTGTIGVVEGNGGDLRVGLAWQSLHDGERLMHQPRRLAVVIEAPIAAIDRVLDRHPDVRQLARHGWLHLLAMNEEGRIAARHRPDGGWEAIEAIEPVPRAA